MGESAESVGFLGRMERGAATRNATLYSFYRTRKDSSLKGGPMLLLAAIKQPTPIPRCEPGSDVGRLLLYNVPTVAALREAERCLTTNEELV